jgi:hypothetical protein
MKKVFTVSFLALLVALTPLAAQTAATTGTASPQGNVAIGPIYSVNFLGLDSPLQGLGITGKIPGLAPVFGLNFSLSPKENRYFFGLTGDWLLYKQPLYEPFNINFYLGPGFYVSSLIASNGRFDLGLRIPVGVNWVPLKFFEAFFEVTPAFGITFQDPIAPSWLFQSALGARVWF